MTMRTTFALAAVLVAAAPALTPRGARVAQAQATAHRYVVGVSGMH
jgi:hypothetical protein